MKDCECFCFHFCTTSKGESYSSACEYNTHSQWESGYSFLHFKEAAIVQKRILRAPEHCFLLYFSFPAPQWIPSNKPSSSAGFWGIMGFPACLCFFFSSSPDLCFQFSLRCSWDSSPGFLLSSVNGTSISSITDRDLRCRNSGPDLLGLFDYPSLVSLSWGLGDTHALWWLRGPCPPLHHLNHWPHCQIQLHLTNIAIFAFASYRLLHFSSSLAKCSPLPILHPDLCFWGNPGTLFLTLHQHLSASALFKPLFLSPSLQPNSQALFHLELVSGVAIRK